MSKEEPYQKNQEDEAEVARQEAISRYLRGEKPSAIAREMGKSRMWFYKTLKKYREHGRAGLVTQSKAPKRVHNRTSDEVEQAVVRIRRTIESGVDPELRYAYVGGAGIAAELARLGYDPPSVRTIQRILRRYDLSQPRRPKKEAATLPSDYPWPTVIHPNQMHVFDFVSRSVGGQRFYSCHLLDQHRQWPYLDIITSKNVASVSAFFTTAWQNIALPQALHMDNDVVWRGSSRASLTISRIIRLCLYLGIEVIFTPPYTPKANPLIESFNAVWDYNFWLRTTFTDLEHLRREFPLFVSYYRHRRPNRPLWDSFQPCLLDPADLPTLDSDFPLTAGHVHFIRFVSHKGTFSLLNRSWQLDSQWHGCTIRASLDTQAQLLTVYHQPADQSASVIAQFACPLRQMAVPLVQSFQRDRIALWPSDS